LRNFPNNEFKAPASLFLASTDALSRSIGRAASHRAPLEFSRDLGARGDGVAARPLSGSEFGGYEEGSVFGII